MHIVIEIPNKDIPKHQEVIDIRLHFIDEHIVDADGYGFMELPKGHGRLIDADELKYKINSFDDNVMEEDWYSLYDAVMTDIDNASAIIEADKTESGDKE